MPQAKLQKVSAIALIQILPSSKQKPLTLLPILKQEPQSLLQYDVNLREECGEKNRP